MLPNVRAHWPEYLIELVSLALFMVSATLFAILLQHPSSPLADWPGPAALRRLPMGIAMGLTLLAIIYSPLGARSGAHMNPVLTFTFLRLGKIAPADAAAYVVAQFGGGLLGIAAASFAWAPLTADPAVNYVATLPGAPGPMIAAVAEAAISFGMMLTVLLMSNDERRRRYTGMAAAILVCAYITVEAPLSGMSMNPARSLGPALLAQSLDTMWIYFAGPLVGMTLAAQLYVRARGSRAVRCAKLHHPKNVPCIFRCTLGEQHEVQV